MKNLFIIDKMPNWFRWFLVPTTTIITFLLTPIVLNLFSLLHGNFDSPLATYIVGPTLTSFTAVSFGSAVAPHNQFRVSLIIGAIFVLMSGITIGIELIDNSGRLISTFIVMISTATGACLAIMASKTN